MIHRHPVHRYRRVTRIAKMRWSSLAAFFLCLVILTAVLLGLARSAFYPDNFYGHVWEEIARYLMILIDVRDAAEPEGTTLISTVFGVIAGLAKLILIVGLLGSVVFKFLIIPDVFQTRKKASIAEIKADNTWRLTLRIYNATLLEIVDIEFSAFLRVPVTGAKGARSVPNQKVDIDSARNRDRWPIAIPFVPFSVDINLEQNDVSIEGGKTTLKAIQSKPIAPSPAEGGGASFLVLVIKGKRPELGADITETHWYRLSGNAPDYEFGKFEEIFTVPGEEPKQYGGTPSEWQGWDKFEMTEQSFDETQERAWIFGYGSLVNESNLKRFLSARGLLPANITSARLNGFHRAWNVAMDNGQNIPGYKYYVDAQTGDRPDGFISFLNIYRKAGSFVNGVLFEIPAAALAEFDRRERNYDRIDVTDAFDGTAQGRIWAYVAKEDGLGRFGKGISNGTAIIDQYYRDEVERAFRSLGPEGYQTYLATTDAPTIAARNLRQIDIPKDL